jgi:hypothetical protein
MLFESASTGRIGVDEHLWLSVELAAEAVESAPSVTIPCREIVDDRVMRTPSYSNLNTFYRNKAVMSTSFAKLFSMSCSLPRCVLASFIFSYWYTETDPLSNVVLHPVVLMGVSKILGGFLNGLIYIG